MAELSLADLGQQLKKDFLAITTDLTAAEDWQSEIERSWDTAELVSLQTALGSLADIPSGFADVYAGLTGGFVPAITAPTQDDPEVSQSATTGSRGLSPTPLATPGRPTTQPVSKEVIRAGASPERNPVDKSPNRAAFSARLAATRRPLAANPQIQPNSAQWSTYRASQLSAGFLTPSQPENLFPIQTLRAQPSADSTQPTPAFNAGKLESSELSQNLATTPTADSRRSLGLQIANLSLENLPDDSAEVVSKIQPAKAEFWQASEAASTLQGLPVSQSLAAFARRLTVEDLSLEAENETVSGLPQSERALAPAPAIDRDFVNRESSLKIAPDVPVAGNYGMPGLESSTASGSLANFAANSTHSNTTPEFSNLAQVASFSDFANSLQNEGSEELRRLVAQAEQAAKFTIPESADSVFSNISEPDDHSITGNSTEFFQNRELTGSPSLTDLPAESTNATNSVNLGSLKQLASRLQEDFEKVSALTQPAAPTLLNPQEKKPSLTEQNRNLYDRPEESNLRLQNMPGLSLDLDALVEALTKEIWRDYRRFYGN